MKLPSFDPAPGVGVNILSTGAKKPVNADVTTDSDGWYMWSYTYTGKPATFTVSVPDDPAAVPTPAQLVTLKANGYLSVDFHLTVDLP